MHRLIIAVAVSAGIATPALAGDRYEARADGGWKSERSEGPYEVKEEVGADAYKYELKGPGREVKREAKADGSWKEEIKAGDCEIKREMSASGRYKEERDCD